MDLKVAAHNSLKHWLTRRKNGINYVLHQSVAVPRLDPKHQWLVPVAIAGVDRDKQRAPTLWLDALSQQQPGLAKLSGA